MEQYIGCDAHRRYSVFVSMDEKGRASKPVRVEHERREIRGFLRRLQPGTPVAVEATGSWYWLVDEIEAAGLQPRLAQPFAARRMLGGGAKTDGIARRSRLRPRCLRPATGKRVVFSLAFKAVV